MKKRELEASHQVSKKMDDCIGDPSTKVLLSKKKSFYVILFEFCRGYQELPFGTHALLFGQF